MRLKHFKTISNDKRLEMHGYFFVFLLLVLGKKFSKKFFKTIEISTLLLENIKFKRIKNYEYFRSFRNGQ